MKAKAKPAWKQGKRRKKERRKWWRSYKKKKKEFLAGLNFSHCRSLGQHCLGVVHDSDTVRTEPEQHQDYDQFLVARWIVQDRDRWFMVALCRDSGFVAADGGGSWGEFSASPNCIALWRSRYKIISSSWPPWCSSSCPKCSHPLPFLLSAVSFLRLRKATIRHCLGLYCSKLCA